MSLQDFQEEIDSISGVKRTVMITDETLQVTWFGKPADYSTQIRELRNEYPQIAQVEPPTDDLPTRTGDAMPIVYYQTE